MDQYLLELEVLIIELEKFSSLATLIQETSGLTGPDFRGYLGAIYLLSDGVFECSEKLRELFDAMFEEHRQRAQEGAA